LDTFSCLPGQELWPQKKAEKEEDSEFSQKSHQAKSITSQDICEVL